MLRSFFSYRAKKAINKPSSYLTVRMETVSFVSKGVLCLASVSRSDADLSV